MKLEFKIPDPRFNVAVAIDGSGRRGYVFAHTLERRSPHNAPWVAVEGASIYIVGNADDALIGLINQHGNAGLAELIGISPTQLRKLREHLGIAGPSGYGGRRPGAGATKKP